MPHFAFPGVGERIKERLAALGYGTVEDPDIGRFIREHHYDGRYFYPWVNGRTPTGDYLLRLAADLECSRAWLLLGEGARPRKMASIAGGSDPWDPKKTSDNGGARPRPGRGLIHVLCQVRPKTPHHWYPLPLAA